MKKQSINKSVALSGVIARFFEATKNYNEQELFATFSKQIKVIDEGKLVISEELKKWNADVFFGVKITLEPLSVRHENNMTVVEVLLNGDYSKYNITGPFHYEGWFGIENEEITYLEFKPVRE